MSTTIKRCSFCLTKDMQKQMEELCEALGDTQSQVIKLALNNLYSAIIVQKKQK